MKVKLFIFFLLVTSSFLAQTNIKTPKIDYFSDTYDNPQMFITIKIDQNNDIYLEDNLIKISELDNELFDHIFKKYYDTPQLLNVIGINFEINQDVELSYVAKLFTEIKQLSFLKVFFSITPSSKIESNFVKRGFFHRLNSFGLENESYLASKVQDSIEQSKLNEAENLNEFLTKDFPGQKFIAHCEEGMQRFQLKDKVEAASKVTILIGPEGDFSPAEISRAIDNNFTPLSLGNYRLRTETAGIVACSAVYL
ncbi:MAG: RsmE family RNA methyltransferase, partial [Psychroflexus sp.]